MKHIFAALLFTPGIAAAACFVHPDTGRLHCSSGAECPQPSAWDSRTLACLPPASSPAPACTGVDSGSYTPDVAELAHVFQARPQRAFWTRVGAVVSVTGAIDVQPTGAGVAHLLIGPPISTTFVSEHDAAGVSAVRSEGAAPLNAVAGGSQVRFVFFGWDQHLSEAIRYSYSYRINECPS